MAGFRRGKKRRSAASRRQVTLLLIIAAVAAIAALIAVLVSRRSAVDTPINQTAEIAAAPTAVPILTVTAEPTDVPTTEPTPEPVDRSATRPKATAEGFLPVFSRAYTEEKIVAITVDDCFQAENLQEMVDTAIQYGAKFTIFPIGENVVRQRQSEVLKYAWENGFELENHTYTHNGLYACSDEELAREVYLQQLALSEILGVEYHCHFLRPMGGSASWDQRIHQYASQLGYYGIAHWSATSASGSLSDRRLAEQLQPGAIYLFHTTDKDKDKLVRFIPWLIEQGYQLVTLNEMFGYPENETYPLTQAARDYPIPPLEEYEPAYATLKRGTYSYGVYLLQQKLIDLGYLEDEPDGIYGPKCEAAVKAWQKAHSMEETGVADATVQKGILEGE